MSVTDDLIEFVQSLTFDALPVSVIEKGKQCVLDLVGAMVVGSETEAARASRDFAFQHFKDGSATVVGVETQLSEDGAAWANSTAAGAWDVDDGHRLAMGHPGAVVIPAAFAAGETQGIGGRDLLTAIVAGYEVAVRVSAARVPGYKHRQYATGIWGGYGAATAAGKLLELDRDIYQSVFGNVAAHSPLPPSGATVCESMVKEVAGWACMLGCASVQLAMRGYEGPRDILDDPDRFDAKTLSDGLGEKFAIQDVYFKPYPACQWAHSAIDGVLQLVSEKKIGAGDIEGVLVEAFYEVTRMCRSTPRTIYGAQHDLPFLLAAAILYGGVGPDELTDHNLENRQIRQLASKVKVRIDPELDSQFPERTVARVKIATATARFETTVEYPKGSPENPLTRSELVGKFRSLSKRALSGEKMDALVHAVDTLEQLDSIREVTNLLR